MTRAQKTSGKASSVTLGTFLATILGVSPAATLALPALPHSTQVSGEKTDKGEQFPATANNDLKILYFIDHLRGTSVYINGGSEQGILPGAILHSHRAVPGSPSDSPAGIPTGTLKVTSLGQGYAIAKIVKESPHQARNHFLKHPGVMAGDRVRVPGYRLRSVTQLLPVWSRRYLKLFRIPGAQPASFELSKKGREIIRQELGILGEKYISGIFVRGHTDAHGSASQNQIESYQRALTVRQFLIDELGFDPERVIALGMGETELKNKSNVHGAVEENRRIEVTVIRIPKNK